MTWEDSGDGDFEYDDFAYETQAIADGEFDSEYGADWEDELGEELDNAGAR